VCSRSHSREKSSRTLKVLRGACAVLSRVRMKLHVLGPVVVMLATAMITGCGPGLTQQAGAPRAPQAPTDVLHAVDAELATAIAGTTTLTGATLPTMPLPESRMPVSQSPGAKANDAAPPPVQTWGVAPELDPELSEYGF
jgi:hypothetical protein